jgi:cellulose synthase/poly-beta-1,6-N-acetylglucosamine synthase-like glycosyltransferase
VSLQESIILWIYGLIIAAWPIRHLVLTWIHRKFDFLTRQSPLYRLESHPLITAMIPAKDEETELPECLDTVLAQSYPNLEVLVIDDRSCDATALIASRYAEKDPRVRLISIQNLPDGWTGKSHALSVASREARGSWLWLLDADTRHVPDCLSITMEYARQEDAALVSLVPEMRCETFWEGVVQPLAGIVLMRSFPLFAVNDDRSRLAFANGQYVLIRRDAYDAIGGHAAVRDRFTEDISLARLVKCSGRRIRVAMAGEISSTRMYATLPQLVRGWSRILYDGLGRRMLPLFGKILEPLIFSQTFFFALVGGFSLLALGHNGPFAYTLIVLSMVHLALQITVLWRMYGWSSPATARFAIWYPLAGLVSDWILFRAILLCWTGKVTWRGTSYGSNPEPAHPSSPASAADVAAV